MKWLENLVDFAASNLGEREREALWMRGVSDDQIELYRLGCLDGTLPPLDYSQEFLDWSWNGRRLDDVFVLPLTNTLGQIKGLQFRHVDQSIAGYRDFIPYEDEPVFFGLAQAMSEVWRTGSIWLVEGGFDLFPIQRAFPNVTATLTARVTREFSRLLRRIATEIWLGYDMDDAGRRACARFVHEGRHDFDRINVVEYPRLPKARGEGWTKDPAELWEVWGDAKMLGFLKRLVDPQYKEQQAHA